MRYLPDDIEMKKIDKDTIEGIGIPSMVLMERAALAVVMELEHRLGTALCVLCVCGCGNNGADGLAVARILESKGHTAHIWIPVLAEHPSKEWKEQRRIIENLNIMLVESPCLAEYTVIVDALFGVGCQRELTGIYEDTVRRINESKAFVMSVDIPSGIHAKDGHLCGIAVKADSTVTFGMEKLGMVLYPGAEYVGSVCVTDIGFAKAAVEKACIKGYTYDEEDLQRIPGRKACSHKGDYGKVLVVAGSKNMSGAAYFAASAVFRMGAGLVRIFTCEENREILQIQLPQAVLTTYRTGASVKAQELSAKLLNALAWADTVIIGPGLSEEKEAQDIAGTVFQYAQEHPDVPMVWDADALNIISRKKTYRMMLHERMIITPHLGEMARLLEKSIPDIQGALVQTAKEAARTLHVICVLKDARTIVSDGEDEFYVNSSGNDGMASGGSGDVLSGVIGGLLAGGLKPYEAAVLGVYLHGLAGDAAKVNMGAYSMGAEDILKGMTEVLMHKDDNRKECHILGKGYAGK